MYNTIDFYYMFLYYFMYMSTIQTNQVYTPQEAAELLNFTVDHIYRLIRSKKIKTNGARKGIRILGQSLVDYLK